MSQTNREQNDEREFVVLRTRWIMKLIRENQAVEQDIMDYFADIDEFYCKKYHMKPTKILMVEIKTKGERGFYRKQTGEIFLKDELVRDCVAGKADFSELLAVWAHEYGHRIQHFKSQLYETYSLDEQDKVDERARNIISSINRSRLKEDSFKFLFYAFRPYLSEEYLNYLKNMNDEKVADFFKELFFSYYVQQKEEEQARDIGYNFAMTILTSIVQLDDCVGEEREWLLKQFLDKDDFVTSYKEDYFIYQRFIEEYKKLNLLDLVNIEKIIEHDIEMFVDTNDRDKFNITSSVVYRNVIQDLLKGKSTDEVCEYYLTAVRMGCPLLAQASYITLEHDLMRNQGVDFEKFSDDLVDVLVNSDMITCKTFDIDFSKFLTIERLSKVFDGLFNKKRINFCLSLTDTMIGSINQISDENVKKESYKLLNKMIYQNCCDYAEELLAGLELGEKDLPYFDYENLKSLTKQVISIAKYVGEDVSKAEQLLKKLSDDEWKFDEILVPPEIKDEWLQEGFKSNMPIVDFEKMLSERTKEYIDSSNQGKLKRLIYGDAYVDGGFQIFVNRPLPEGCQKRKFEDIILDENSVQNKNT